MAYFEYDTDDDDYDWIQEPIASDTRRNFEGIRSRIGDRVTEMMRKRKVTKALKSDLQYLVQDLTSLMECMDDMERCLTNSEEQEDVTLKDYWRVKEQILDRMKPSPTEKLEAEIDFYKKTLIKRDTSLRYAEQDKDGLQRKLNEEYKLNLSLATDLGRKVESSNEHQLSKQLRGILNDS